MSFKYWIWMNNEWMNEWMNEWIFGYLVSMTLFFYPKIWLRISFMINVRNLDPFFIFFLFNFFFMFFFTQFLFIWESICRMCNISVWYGYNLTNYLLFGTCTYSLIVVNYYLLLNISGTLLVDLRYTANAF